MSRVTTKRKRERARQALRSKQVLRALAGKQQRIVRLTMEVSVDELLAPRLTELEVLVAKWRRNIPGASTVFSFVSERTISDV